MIRAVNDAHRCDHHRRGAAIRAQPAPGKEPWPGPAPAADRERSGRPWGGASDPSRCGTTCQR